MYVLVSETVDDSQQVWIIDEIIACSRSKKVLQHERVRLYDVLNSERAYIRNSTMYTIMRIDELDGEGNQIAA